MGYEEDSNRGGRNESLPSYKLPGVYPSGSQETLGLDNTNLLQGSLGNWNNLIRDSDSDGNPRTFISFASNAEITIPTISGEDVPGRPIFVNITEESIFNNGVTAVGIKGVQRDDWYQEGDSGFNNLKRYRSKRGIINEITTGFEQLTYGGNIAIWPFDLLESNYVEEILDDQSDSDEDELSGASDGQSGQYGGGLTDLEKMSIHEQLNRWMYIVMHYWNVDIQDVKSYLSFVEETVIANDAPNLNKWNEIFGGKFKSELFQNPIGLDSNLFYISQNEGAVEKLAEDETNGPFPTNYKIDFNSDDILLWDKDGNKITGQFPIRFLELEDAFFLSDSNLNLGSKSNWIDLYDSFYRGSEDVGPFQPGQDYGQSTELLIFPRSLITSMPSEILNQNRSQFNFIVQSFPVQSESNPLLNFIGNFPNANQSGNTSKFGFPYFSYDYIFSNEEDDVNIDEQPASRTIVDYQVDCTVSNSDTHLIYYEIGSEEYRKTSYPIEVDLNLKLIDDAIVTYEDPIGGGFNLQSTFALIDMLYGNKNHVDFVLNEVINPPFHFRYDVIQWGDEDVLLTDEQIEASYYFNMYDIESYPPDTDSYEYKKFVQSHIKSKPANSISKHVYNSPGVKRLKIIAYKMSLNGVFVLQTYLIQKNIVVSDGNLSAQDFAVFGLGNYKYLPIKENQAVIGGLSSDSDYNQSVAKILKDDNFTEEDYLERVSSVRYLEKFNQGLLGESSADTISSDIGQVRMFNTPKDIYSFIGGDRLEIINNGLSTLPINSSATDILIDNDNCIVDFNPPNNELFSIQNQAGKDEIGVIVGDYKLVQPKTSRIRRDGDMNRPEIVTEKDRQAF